ncbi:hypothetical protein [Caldimonas brevitalea]|uniref:Uncharacterized protein n=1 Tax=Caldimonas brevitalea TaxID=413882 RepID=A0A0G3BPR7_9BURK|nr:hypothetical protein [Caldimonas brevitalea]AKJ29336.1 hypothetical protein AAW51_2645 [Caldimonas brevitalea]
MEQESLEALLLAGMLGLLSLQATLNWNRQRAVSWGALAVCLLVPEAASRHPNEVLIYCILAGGGAVVTLQLAWDLRRKPQVERAEVTAAVAMGSDRGQRVNESPTLLGAPVAQSGSSEASF